MTPSRLFPLALLAVGLLAPGTADAQGILGRVRRAAQGAAERVVEREADRRATEATEHVLGAPGSTAGGGRAAAGTPGAAGPDAPLVNYDFVPGDRVIFADDLAAETLGDFPTRLTFVQGNAETAEWQGRRFLRVTSFGSFAVDLPETLPERFTLEFEAAVPTGWTQELRFSDDPATYVRFSPAGGGLVGAARAETDLQGLDGTSVFEVKVMGDGDHVKVYMNGTRVANVPTAALGRSGRLTFSTSASAEYPAYFGAFRVAEGGRDLPAVAAAVVAEAPPAPVVLSGVEFDTGRASLRAVSGPVLDAVAASLVANPAVRVRVEGHTDSSGSAETNRALSQARAEAVVAYLVAKGVAADRLQAQGFGPDQPVAPNTTPEGRQQNRRVALARL